MTSRWRHNDVITIGHFSAIFYPKCHLYKQGFHQEDVELAQIWRKVVRCRDATTKRACPLEVRYGLYNSIMSQIRVRVKLNHFFREKWWKKNLLRKISKFSKKSNSFVLFKMTLWVLKCILGQVLKTLLLIKRAWPPEWGKLCFR